jgi:hypothetical protein
MVSDDRVYNVVMRTVPVMLCLAGMLGAADLPPEVLLLARVREHMSGMLNNLPNYTCLQTIERSQRRAPKNKPRLVDIVRIEVALVQGRELFAWPGSGRFVDTEISDLVPGGAIGNGSFALHAKAVFQSGAPAIQYAGEEFWNGRRTLKWTFAVPQSRSGFALRVGNDEAIVGYTGEFRVDPVTLDALRLEVSTKEIPERLRLRSAFNAVEYSRTKIGGSEFLLPSLAELRMVDTDGGESLNRTQFSACRQYTGESTLSFDDPAPGPQQVEAERWLEAPAGLQISLQLLNTVMLHDAAVGDPITAVLTKVLKLPDGTLLPKGALIHGRLTHLRHGYMKRYDALAIGMKFFEIESGRTHVRLDATLQDITTPNPAFLSSAPVAKGLPSERVENETIFGSIFFVRESITRLERGLRMVWRTTPIQSEDKQ